VDFGRDYQHFGRVFPFADRPDVAIDVLWYPVALNKPALPFGHPFVLREYDRREGLDQTPLGTDQTYWRRYRGQTPTPLPHKFCGSADQWTNGLSYETYIADGYQCDCPQLVMVASGGSAGNGSARFGGTGVFCGLVELPYRLYGSLIYVSGPGCACLAPQAFRLQFDLVDSWRVDLPRGPLHLRFHQEPSLAYEFTGSGPCDIQVELGFPAICDPFQVQWVVELNDLGGCCAPGPSTLLVARVSKWPDVMVADGGSAGSGAAEWSSGFIFVSAGGSAGDGSADWPGGDFFVAAGGSAGAGVADWPAGTLLVSAGGSAGNGNESLPPSSLFVSAGGGSAGDGIAVFI